MSADFQVSGQNPAAKFSMKLHRGEGMLLIGMNWKNGEPPADFVGFAIEYKEPGGDRFFALKNRLSFPGVDINKDPQEQSTRLSPIQKFRWVHFPRNAEMTGAFTYKVTPVFMNSDDELSYGDPQEAAIELRRETYPGELNVAFTRGFVSSQAFVDKYGAKSIPQLLPASADQGLAFVPTHPKADQALAWMGFEARAAVLKALDDAIADPGAQVRVVAYDLNEPEVVTRLERLGPRLKVIIDNSDSHGLPGSAETTAADRLKATAGAANVKRQHMGGLQHNKTIVVDGPNTQVAVCGSTNYSWRGFYVQNNNAIVLTGKPAVQIFQAAFDAFWATDGVAGFGKTTSATWNDLLLPGINAQVAFSPHAQNNVMLKTVADDIANNTTSSLLFSLAFLYQTPGPVLKSIKKLAKDNAIFSYGISDHPVAGLDLQKPDGTVSTVSPQALTGKVPPPFKAEPTGGGGTRMHHKFVVIDFDKPTARVFTGSYNFSSAADTTNGENLLLLRDRRIAVSYAVEALRIFDHYHWRVAQAEAKQSGKPLQLAKAPRTAADNPWWKDSYTDPIRILDRQLFG